MNRIVRTRSTFVDNPNLLRAVATLAFAIILGACGGGGGGAGAGGSGGSPTPGSIDLAQRIGAATSTAQSATNLCAGIQPFYWEIGDKLGKRASGSVQPSGSPTYDGTTIMSIASASKWIYGAYVVQARRGQLTADDIKFLTFRSGYTSFSTCLPSHTVDSCLGYQQNGVHSDFTDGKFSYGGGHMQKHASLNGLGALNTAGLAAEIQSQLGADISLAYSQPQLAGGIYTNANAYALFLQRVLSGALLIREALGAHAVCTNPTTCPPGEAVNTPVPTNESYHYSIGHWVEDDPANGDGAFSSAGAFGFYPWIDASKSWYGIVARKDDTETGNGFRSTQCGQLIRKAWISGVTQ